MNISIETSRAFWDAFHGRDAVKPEPQPPALVIPWKRIIPGGVVTVSDDDHIMYANADGSTRCVCYFADAQFYVKYSEFERAIAATLPKEES